MDTGMDICSKCGDPIEGKIPFRYDGNYCVCDTYIVAVDADVAELNDIADWMDALGKRDNGQHLRKIANKLEILAGAYSTASKIRGAAVDFFSWANRTWPNPGGNEDHPWNKLGLLLGECAHTADLHED